MARKHSWTPNLAYEAYNAYLKETRDPNNLFERRWYDLTEAEQEGWMQATLHVERRIKRMYGIET